MSRWSDQFENHQIHETLETASAWLDVDVDAIDAEHEQEQRRLKKVLSLIWDKVSGVDPEFFPQQTFDQVNGHLRHQHFWNQLQQYSSNQNHQHLKTANDHVTSIVSTIFQMPGFSNQSDTQKVVSSIEKSFDGFCAAIETQKSSFEEAVSEQSGKIVAIEGRSSELSSDLDSLRGEVDEQLSTWRTEFTNGQTERAEEYSTAQIERSKEFDEAMREIKSNAETERVATAKAQDEAFKKSYEEFVDNAKFKTTDIDEKHQSILDIHELVATDGVAGGYKKSADDEKKAAFWWSVVSMGCYGLILLWVVFKGRLGFGVATTGALDWPVIVTTISVTAVAFVAAQFASRQSRLHRLNEQRMRWFSLEVKAIDPFISSLPPEMQQELKRQLSERLFGQDRVTDERHAKGIDSGTIKSVTEVVKAIRQ